MSFFREHDNILDKICLVFVVTVISAVVLAAIGGFFYVMWQINPFVAVVTTLFLAAITYLTRGGPVVKP